MTAKAPELAVFSESEIALVKKIAERDGISVEDAATNLGRAALARRTRKRTGKAPAKVYSIRRAHK